MWFAAENLKSWSQRRHLALLVRLGSRTTSSQDGHNELRGGEGAGRGKRGGGDANVTLAHSVPLFCTDSF